MLLRKLATIVGMATVAFGMFSCDSSGTSGPECCTYTYEGTTYRWCEGDMFYGHHLVGDTWNYFKGVFIDYYGATCR
jgi:hypothetical protein